MKKNNMKRLNNKGFTLIELLAVVVILAVVMGIAMTSVLSSMNSSRKGSLQNSAESTAQIFQKKYTEAMVAGGTDSIFDAYDFTVSNTVVYPITETVGTELNLSKSSYVLSTSATALNTSGGVFPADKSFIVFNGEKIVACLVAQNSGSYYVGQAALQSEKTITILGAGFKFAKDTMFACSDEQVSW